MSRSVRSISAVWAGAAFAVVSLTCVSILQAASPVPQDSASEQAQQILKDTGFQGGLIVHLGCGDGQLTAALRTSDNILVQGLDVDVTKVEAARRHIRSRGAYGKVSVEPWTGKQLPYVDNLVNLVVAEDLGGASLEEVMRVLAPRGVACVKQGGQWTKTVKPWPKEIDEWQQHFHDADNNAVAHDSVVGPPRHYQWLSEPEWTRSHLTLPSINSLVSSKGRVFTVEDHGSAEHPALPGKFFLVARDAFNGTVLWQRQDPDWQPSNIYIKFTPVQLQRRLAAIGDILYCTPGYTAPVTALDAATGKTLQTYQGTERTTEFVYDRGALYVVIGDPTDTGGIGIERGSLGPSAFPTKAYGPEIPKLAEPTSTIVAVDADSGRKLWQKSGDETRYYQGSSLAVRGPHAVYCTSEALVCLDRQTGREMWRVAAPVALNGPPGIAVSLVLSDSAVYLAESAQLRAFRLADGKALWTTPVTINHHKAPDVFLANGLVWAAAYDASKGRLAPELGLNQTGANGFDPETGKLVTHLDQGMTGPMGHDRCYRNRITDRYYINSATGGSDFLTLDGSGEFPNPWVRSTCGVGTLPCNGLFYAGPPACSCANKVQLNALNALAPEPRLKSSGQSVTVAIAPQIEKGPAYAAGIEPSPVAVDDDWPTYRKDASRSGHTLAAVPAALQPQWQTRLTTRASPPVIAAGLAFAADVDAHAVCAISVADGKIQWTYTAGGRVDSPPTWHQGRLLFGSRDGWVYCLRATDGALIWRFKALPDRLMCAYGQIESAWPVCGSILVYDNVAYFVAGRNSFLDGGLFLFGLDPQTGRVIHQRNLYGPYGPDGHPVISPETAVGATGAGGIKGNKGDILLAEDGHLFLRHEAFTPDLRSVDPEERIPPHLITSHGFLEAIPHHRSWWTIDTMLRYDIPTGSEPVHGDILVRDGTRYYEVRGYQPSRTAHFDPRLNGYTLFAGDLAKASAVEMPAPKKRAAASRTTVERWSTHIPLTGKAIALAGDVLFVAGTPVAFPEDDLAKAYEGRMGGVLWAASVTTGEKLAEYQLDAAPVWDSMAVAEGRLCLATQDGRLRCFGAKQ